MRFNVPKKASGVTPDVEKNQGNQRADYNENENVVEWVIKKMPG